jgi:hypothetical protein
LAPAAGLPVGQVVAVTVKVTFWSGGRGGGELHVVLAVVVVASEL